MARKKLSNQLAVRSAANTEASAPITERERTEIETRSRRRAWEDEFLGSDLPSDAAQLLAECARLGRVLDETWEPAAWAVADAPEVVERFWRAMRLIDPRVPTPYPHLIRCTPSEASADRLIDDSKRLALHQVIDTVAGWSRERESAAATRTNNQEYEETADPFMDFGGKQRSLLRALFGKGKVNIEKVRRKIYPKGDLRKNSEAFRQLSIRTGRALAERNFSCEIRRQGEAIWLADLDGKPWTPSVRK
jgi:hypothetical protein